jgi:hypothetical protein
MNDNFISIRKLEIKITSITNKMDFSEVRRLFPVFPLITFGYIMYQYKGNPVDGIPFVRLVRYKYLWYQYHFGTTERGEIIDEHYSRNYEDVIYWHFKHLAFMQGDVFVRKYRDEIKLKGFDHRRFHFKAQYDILNQIDPKYGSRFLDEVNWIIRNYPFNDGYPESQIVPIQDFCCVKKSP